MTDGIEQAPILDQNSAKHFGDGTRLHKMVSISTLYVSEMKSVK